MQRRSSLFKGHGNSYSDHITFTPRNKNRKLLHGEEGELEAVILGERKRYNKKTRQWERIPPEERIDCEKNELSNENANQRQIKRMEKERDGEMISPVKHLKYPKNFTKDTAEKYNRTQRTIQLQFTIEEKIIPEVYEFIKENCSKERKYNSGFTFSDCVKIARLDPRCQLCFMREMKGIVNKPGWYKKYDWKFLLEKSSYEGKLERE